jgi:hypothetical protein
MGKMGEMGEMGGWTDEADKASSLQPATELPIPALLFPTSLLIIL